MRLDQPSAGQLTLNGLQMDAQTRLNPREQARQIQYIFQDPLGSLNPRKTIRQILDTPLKLLRGLPAAQRHTAMQQLIESVNMRPQVLERYPHEFSGGQAQRIGIARALAAQAKILILDEPVSALDVSIQAQVLKLLAELKAEFNLSYLFISHDLSVVEGVSDRVAVMYFGRFVEIGPARTLFNTPRHPYTRVLLDSAPVPGQRLRHDQRQMAELPDPLNPPPGCAFAPRCPQAQARCREQAPELAGITHSVACHFPLDRL
ncbi:MAG: ATP-binding cassette domain-containing protein [Thiolinea sp.]